jgi:hypothetical protein
MLNKEKELLLQLLMEKYQEEDEDDCCDRSVISSPLPPEEWEYSSMRDPILLALLLIDGVRNVSVEYSNQLKMRVSVSGGHPQDIAEVLYNHKYPGVVLVSGNYCVDVIGHSVIPSSIYFQYKRC